MIQARIGPADHDPRAGVHFPRDGRLKRQLRHINVHFVMLVKVSAVAVAAAVVAAAGIFAMTVEVIADHLSE